MRISMPIILLLISFFISCKNLPKDKKAGELRTDLLKQNEVITKNEEKEEYLIAKYLKELIKDDYSFLTEKEKLFKYDSFDLNQDGEKEYIAFFQNKYFCGTGGCTYFLMTNKGEPITTFTVSRKPFKVINQKTNGWMDLVIYDNQGQKILKFNGNSYPSNPSIINTDLKNIDNIVIYTFLQEPVKEFSI